MTARRGEARLDALTLPCDNLCVRLDSTHAVTIGQLMMMMSLALVVSMRAEQSSSRHQQSLSERRPEIGMLRCARVEMRGIISIYRHLDRPY